MLTIYSFLLTFFFRDNYNILLILWLKLFPLDLKILCAWKGVNSVIRLLTIDLFSLILSNMRKHKKLSSYEFYYTNNRTYLSLYCN